MTDPDDEHQEIDGQLDIYDALNTTPEGDPVGLC